MPRLSVIIPVRDGERQLAACLAAVCPSPSPAAWEVIVVDDGSTDATAAVAARFPCRLLRQPHRGVAAARNAGIDAARAPLLLFLDADVRLHPGMLELVTDWFDTTPSLAVLQGIYDPDAPGANAFFRFLHRRHWCCIHARNGVRLPVANLESGCLALRRAVITECGRFDERFLLPGGEEHELGMRIAARFPVTYEPRFTATHDCHGVLPTLRDMLRRSAVFAGLVLRHRGRTLLAAQRVSLPYWDQAGMWLLWYLPVACLAATAGTGPAAPLLLPLWCACFLAAQAPLAVAIARRWGLTGAAWAMVCNPLILLPRFAGLLTALVLYIPQRWRERAAAAPAAAA